MCFISFLSKRIRPGAHPALPHEITKGSQPDVYMIFQAFRLQHFLHVFDSLWSISSAIDSGSTSWDTASITGCSRSITIAAALEVRVRRHGILVKNIGKFRLYVNYFSTIRPLRHASNSQTIMTGCNHPRSIQNHYKDERH